MVLITDKLENKRTMYSFGSAIRL